MTEPTASHQKVQHHHLERDAYLYVRQSSMRQVLENTESTRRQYQLRERALALGWQSEQIRVIDCDQGQSGASEVGRDGFQQLVAEVSLGKAGIVMGLEVSRLARNNADWQRLLQLCAFADSLILDQDGLYDPASFNDRLLLGLKGTMSEAELHVLRTRLQEGILSKARRGELKTALPVGLVYDELDRVVLSPDSQVRGALQRFFDAFQRLGSASAVVREFRREGIQMPRHSRTGAKPKPIIWGDLIHTQALHILHNPRYGGAFAFGRHRVRRGPDGRMKVLKQPQEQWISLIPDAHDGYISWDQYQRNEQTLAANAWAYSSDRRPPPREGPALLQGLVICGICGKRMTVRYHRRRGRLVPDYVCQRDRIRDGCGRTCQHIPGADIDTAVGDFLVTMFNDQSIDIAVTVHNELQQRLDQADQLRLQQVERCRYEADLSRRRYLKVDPEKRYVAQVLEADWNDKLRDLDEAQNAYEQARERDKRVLDEEQLRILGTLSDDFKAIWCSNTLADRDRKRMVRLLIADVTLTRNGKASQVRIRIKGGQLQQLQVPVPPPATRMRTASPQLMTEIDRLLDTMTDKAIADDLNARGISPPDSPSWTGGTVGRLRRSHHLKPRYERLREQGLLTATEIATELGVTPTTVRAWRAYGILKGYEYNGKGERLYELPPPEGRPRKQQGRTRKLTERGKAPFLPHATNEVQCAG